MKILRRAPRPPDTDGTAAASDAEAVAALRRELTEVREAVSALRVQAADASRQTEQLLAAERGRVNDRASLAGLPRARLLSTSIALEGPAAARMRVRRVSVGELVERPFSRSFGITRCATESADVRELWERLLAFEAACGEDVLRGLPSTVLDVADATVSVADGAALRISLGGVHQPSAPVVAVPRFTYDYPARKANNFGHWLLDCVPQVAVLAKMAPEALFLLPHRYKAFQHATLSLLGLEHRQFIPWDGSPVECSRLLALESDGRTGGGRPFSPLMEVRRRLAARAEDGSAGGHRRLYVSRRDAGAGRQWVTNESDVEALFLSRGFEVVVMGECSLDQQVRMFREAEVVAGVSGAGLTDIVFSSRGTHVIVLLSDALIRWYADEDGARSLWSGARGNKGKQLAAFGDSPRFYAHLTAGFEQVCHSFVAGDQMPLGQLSGFLDDVLAEVNRG